MEQPIEKKYTSDEFFAMTDLKGRYELIDGEIYDMAPAPSINHQRIVRKLLGKIDRYIEDNHGKCEVFSAPCDVKINEKLSVQPDLFVVCDPDKLDEHRCNGAPDWVIEILSPSNSDHDTRKKLYLYSETGVREYWIVDPMEERVTVYNFGETGLIGLYTFDDDIAVGIYKDEEEPLTICINKLIKRSLTAT